MSEFCEHSETIVKNLESDMVNGLTLAQVKERQEKFGKNKLKEKKKKSWLSRFGEQFKDAMIIILIIGFIVV